MSTTTQINHDRVQEFAGQVMADDAAALSMVLAHLDDRLGLYRAMAGAGPVTPAEVAERSGTHARYVREWLNNQAAGGWVSFDGRSGTYRLPDEHAAVLAIEDSPAFMLGGLEALGATWARVDQLEEAFRTGDGLGWDEQDPRLFTVLRGGPSGPPGH